MFLIRERVMRVRGRLETRAMRNARQLVNNTSERASTRAMRNARQLVSNTSERSSTRVMRNARQLVSNTSERASKRTSWRASKWASFSNPFSNYWAWWVGRLEALRNTYIEQRMRRDQFNSIHLFSFMCCKKFIANYIILDRKVCKCLHFLGFSCAVD